jgi:rSAM/selenodomain-associated transferase 1
MKHNHDPLSNNLLIIFYRNPVLGKVKTRLARTVGDKRALTIYRQLAKHTALITRNIKTQKAVYYSDHIENEDIWDNLEFQKFAQSGVSLGQRMSNALRAGFTSGHTSICIIGTDCFELTSTIIEDAFEKLQKADAVIGPAADGGYYLLGVNTFQPGLFENKSWSTSSVAAATIEDFVQAGLRFEQLATLRDVDEEKDLPTSLKIR